MKVLRVMATILGFEEISEYKLVKVNKLSNCYELKSIDRDVFFQLISLEGVLKLRPDLKDVVKGDFFTISAKDESIFINSRAPIMFDGKTMTQVVLAEDGLDIRHLIISK